MVLLAPWAWAQAQPLAPTAQSAGINPHDVTIIRDSYGVPHIYAPTDAGCAYGLAWAYAEDAFPKIQAILKAGSGTVGEVAGVQGAAVDYFVQYIRARQMVDSLYDKELTPAFRQVLEGYMAGLNSYAAHHPEEVIWPGILPAKPQDLVRSFYAAMAGFVGVPIFLQDILEGDAERHYKSNPFFASNALAVSGKVTDNGQTLLAINPHMPLRGPLSFYEAHMESGQGLSTVGCHYPGMPGPGLGSNQHLGWAMTYNWPDFVDVYRLRVNPKNKNQYWFDGQWRNFEVSKAKLRVRLLGAVSIDHLSMHDWLDPKKELRTWGPVISAQKELLWSVYGPALRDKKGRVYATRFAHENIIRAVEQWFQMGKGQNLEQFRQALRIQGIPLFNVVYADKDQNVMFQFNALLPHRAPGYNWQAALPGDTSATLWRLPYVPVDSLPRVLNPQCGYVYSCNNSPLRTTAPADYPNPAHFADTTNQGVYWNTDNVRDWAFREILYNHPQAWNMDTVLRILRHTRYSTDTAGFVAKDMLLIHALRPDDHPKHADAIRLLQSWNLESDTLNRATALARLTLMKLYKEADADHGTLAAGPKYSTKLLIDCIDYAQKHLLKHFGRIDPLYGQLHRHSRPGEGGKATVSYAIPGQPESIFCMAGKVQPDGTLNVYHANTYSQYVSFDPATGRSQILSIVPFGTSDHPTSPHYQDQLPLYARQQFKLLETDKQKLLDTAERVYSPK